MAAERDGAAGYAKLVVAALATLLWVGLSLVFAGVVEAGASLAAVNLGVPLLGLLFAYHVFFHEGEKEWATVVAGVLAVTSAVGLVAMFVRSPEVTFAANVLVLLGMFALVAFLWR